MLKHLKSYGFVAAAAAVVLSGCSSHDITPDAVVLEQKQKQDYANNFVKHYGTIDANQTWDFTSNKVRLGTRAASDEILIETVDGLDWGVEETVDENNKYTYTLTKNLDLYNDVPKKLPEKVRHTGESAILVAPSNDFYIYPISCQGAWSHDFCIKVGDADPVKVYHKFWSDYSKPYVNGMATNYSIKDSTLNVSRRAEMPGVHIYAPTGTPVEIYLDKLNNGNAPLASTVTGSAIVLKADAKPEGVPLNENSIVEYIGIEDQYDYDFDYNDMVLCVVGNPDTPPTEKIEDEKYTVNTNVTKRYMIEDLGATDDFDFNDIVVDVTENVTYTHHRTYKTNEAGERTEITDIITNTAKSQKAVIRHLGGTLPFTLKIGNTTISDVAPQLDVDVNISKNISGWNPDTNNISIQVEQTSGAVFTVQFPKAGEAPMIIAVDPDQQWMPERQSVPNSWFYLPE
ncbi:MAG: hypothetical protein IJ588_01525 [Prevotella sp.]|nr:hypothetical protein [Prevotella sp.]